MTSRNHFQVSIQSLCAMKIDFSNLKLFLIGNYIGCQVSEFADANEYVTPDKHSRGWWHTSMIQIQTHNIWTMRISENLEPYAVVSLWENEVQN